MNTHLHKPDWYKLGVRFDHLIHDPRFWAAIVLATLLVLMILAAIFTRGQNTTYMTFPRYVYSP